MFKAVPIATLVGTAPPAGAHEVIRYMLGRRLDYDPGTQYAYSNFGYCLLGRIIETITGKGYDEFVRESVLKPAGIQRMKIGSSRGQAEGECRPNPVDESRPGCIGDCLSWLLGRSVICNCPTN